jgi:hypothetical protein
LNVYEMRQLTVGLPVSLHGVVAKLLNSKA